MLSPNQLAIVVGGLAPFLAPALLALAIHAALVLRACVGRVITGSHMLIKGLRTDLVGCGVEPGPVIVDRADSTVFAKAASGASGSESEDEEQPLAA